MEEEIEDGEDYDEDEQAYEDDRHVRLELEYLQRIEQEHDSYIGKLETVTLVEIKHHDYGRKPGSKTRAHNEKAAPRKAKLRARRSSNRSQVRNALKQLAQEL